MLDYLLAREVAIDAAELGVVAAHSLLLCFMCGPVGYLSHQLTKRLCGVHSSDDSVAAPA